MRVLYGTVAGEVQWIPLGIFEELVPGLHGVGPGVAYFVFELQEHTSVCFTGYAIGEAGMTRLQCRFLPSVEVNECGKGPGCAASSIGVEKTASRGDLLVMLLVLVALTLPIWDRRINTP